MNGPAYDGNFVSIFLEVAGNGDYFPPYAGNSPCMLISNAARGAIGGWAKTLSLELPPEITVNTVLPGYTRTQRVDSIAAKLATDRGTSPEAIVAGWVEGVPGGRLGEPEELAELVAFLASPAAAYIRGAAIPVDGGWLRSV